MEPQFESEQASEVCSRNAYIRIGQEMARQRKDMIEAQLEINGDDICLSEQVRMFEVTVQRIAESPESAKRGEMIGSQMDLESLLQDD
jgi:hypothetical protein